MPCGVLGAQVTSDGNPCACAADIVVCVLVGVCVCVWGVIENKQHNHLHSMIGDDQCYEQNK